MATFLMIHGAWHGGWAFDRLRAPLEALGHVMVAPTLPGMDGREADIASATLEGWAQFVVEAARGLPGPVILCGHSRGGIVISQAAEQDPGAFAALVYIAAFMLPAGRTLIEARDTMPRDEAMAQGLSVTADGAALAISPEAAGAAFYQDCPAEARDWALARLVPEPLAPLNTPLVLTPARFGRLPRHYIECTLDRTIPIADQRTLQADLPCASVTTLVCGHSPFLTMPDALAGALNQLAERIAE